jgi:hypothetical protein
MNLFRQPNDPRTQGPTFWNLLCFGSFKESNETTTWLEVTAKSALYFPEALVAIIAENRELCRTIGASIKIACASASFAE